MKLLSVVPSDKPDKKMKAVFEVNGRTRTIHFGQKKADDFTITKDKDQRERYLLRHKSRENWDDPLTAGSLAKHILWGNSTNIHTNIAEFKKKFYL
jgi:ferric iron reductase protein FhuF